MARPPSAQTIEMDNLVDLGSRETSASTNRMEVFTLQDFDRESTEDSLQVWIAHFHPHIVGIHAIALQINTGPLHRSKPMKFAVAESEVRPKFDVWSSSEWSKNNGSHGQPTVGTFNPKHSPHFSLFINLRILKSK
jgi:hypothetical protein